MAHQHSHRHDHGHHSTNNFDRAFIVSVALNAGFVVIEAIYGILANSLALLADAGHNLSDVLGLLLAWGASLLVRRQPTPRRTFGFRRSTILAALINAILLLIACGGIGWEAIQRFRTPNEVAGQTVIVVAAIGIVINTVSALMFVAGRKTDLNIRGAFLHLAADAAISLGVVLTGIAIVVTGWQWLDPAVSLGVMAVIVVGTWHLFQESFNLVMDAVPAGIEPLAVRTYLSERPGVVHVHDLHIWAMSTTEAALTVHLVTPNGHPGDEFLAELCHELHDHFGIEHATIQIELGDSDRPCALAPENVV
ncbi:cation transporter [Pseudanabaenaceae cyanobacterium LEGE 13415]|nr:cation transporter [Pseudanabaenaceae cyanobacterium LEGE 13415]